MEHQRKEPLNLLLGLYFSLLLFQYYGIKLIEFPVKAWKRKRIRKLKTKRRNMIICIVSRILIHVLKKRSHIDFDEKNFFYLSFVS